MTAKKYGQLAFPKIRKPRKPANPKVSEPEITLQERAEELCDLLGLRYTHVPGNLQRYLRMGAPAHIAAIASRAFKGQPDLCIYKRGNGEWADCLLLEIKTEAGTLSQGQRNWHKGLPVHVTHGWADTEAVIRRFAG